MIWSTGCIDIISSSKIQAVYGLWYSEWTRQNIEVHIQPEFSGYIISRQDIFVSTTVKSDQ